MDPIFLVEKGGSRQVNGGILAVKGWLMVEAGMA